MCIDNVYQYIPTHIHVLRYIYMHKCTNTHIYVL